MGYYHYNEEGYIIIEPETKQETISEDTSSSSSHFITNSVTTSADISRNITQVCKRKVRPAELWSLEELFVYKMAKSSGMTLQAYWEKLVDQNYGYDTSPSEATTLPGGGAQNKRVNTRDSVPPGGMVWSKSLEPLEQFESSTALAIGSIIRSLDEDDDDDDDSAMATDSDTAGSRSRTGSGDTIDGEFDVTLQSYWDQLVDQNYCRTTVGDHGVTSESANTKRNGDTSRDISSTIDDTIKTLQNPQNDNVNSYLDSIISSLLDNQPAATVTQNSCQAPRVWTPQHSAVTSSDATVTSPHATMTSPHATAAGSPCVGAASNVVRDSDCMYRTYMAGQLQNGYSRDPDVGVARAAHAGNNNNLTFMVSGSHSAVNRFEQTLASAASPVNQFGQVVSSAVGNHTFNTSSYQQPQMTSGYSVTNTQCRTYHPGDNGISQVSVGTLESTGAQGSFCARTHEVRNQNTVTMPSAAMVTAQVPGYSPQNSPPSGQQVAPQSAQHSPTGSYSQSWSPSRPTMLHAGGQMAAPTTHHHQSEAALHTGGQMAAPTTRHHQSEAALHTSGQMAAPTTRHHQSEAALHRSRVGYVLGVARAKELLRNRHLSSSAARSMHHGRINGHIRVIKPTLSGVANHQWRCAMQHGHGRPWLNSEPA